MSSPGPSSPAAPPAPPTAVTFRLPKLAYLVVLFLVFCVVPLAFTGQGTESAPAVLGPQTALLVIPVIAAIFIARNSTVVDGRGITVRLAFGSKTMPWDDVRGLSVDVRTIYLVGRTGSIRLPCVRIGDLAALSKASGGRLPEVAEPVVRAAPSRRRPGR